MLTYTCDISSNVDFAYLAELMEATNSTMAIIQANGPGGGNPEVEFTFHDQADHDRFVAEMEG